MIGVIAGKEAEMAKTIEKEINGVKRTCYPLNSGQKFLYYTCLMYTDRQESLDLGISMQFEGQMDFDALKRAIKKAYDRNECSRIRLTEYEAGGNKGVLQYISDEEPEEPEIVDLSDKTPEEAKEVLLKWTQVVFDLFDKPLLFIKLLKLPNNRSGYYMNVYHLLMDAYSSQMFMYDILDLYLAETRGLPEPKPMRSYIEALEKELEYLESPKAAEDIAYFKNEVETTDPLFADYLRPSRLIETREKANDPTLRSAAVYGLVSDGDVFKDTWTVEETEKLIEFTKKNHLTVPCTLMTGVRCALSTINNRQDNLSFRLMLNCRASLLEKRSGGNVINYVNARHVIPETTTFKDTVDLYGNWQKRMFRHAKANYLHTIGFQREKDKTPLSMPMHTYEPLGFSYWPPMEHKMPEDVKKGMELVMCSTRASQQNLYITNHHRPSDGALEIGMEYKLDENPLEDIKVFYKIMKGSIMMGIENPDITLGEIFDEFEKLL